MKIEKDAARIVSGVRGGKTLGSPVTLDIQNKDWENWQAVMSVEADGLKKKPFTRVRPGHADLAGMLKYGADDTRDVLERASARETAVRVAAGAVAKQLLSTFGIAVRSFTRAIGPIAAVLPARIDWKVVEASRVRCSGEVLQKIPHPQQFRNAIFAEMEARRRSVGRGAWHVT